MKAAIAIGLGLALSACAGPHASGTYQSNATYNRLYASALSAVPQVGYTVTTASKADGLIVAQQGVVLGGGSANGLNVSISDVNGTRQLGVNFQAPPGTLALGSYDENVARYIAAVKQQVPDLRASR